MTSRPVLVSTAGLSALLLCTTAGSAGAASAAKPAQGAASSVLSLLQVSAGGHQLRVGDVSLLSDTLTGTARSTITVIPVTADGQTIGEQVLTPDSPSFSVPSASSPGALSSLLSVTSPALLTSVTNAPSSHAGATSLGSLKIAGLSVPLKGTLDLGSSVGSVAGAKGVKAVSLQGLALPSIGDLLAALGLDLTKLPVPTLNTLVSQLGLVDSAVTTARTTATAALAQLNAAGATVATATTAVTNATAGVTSATASATSASTALTNLLSTVPASTALALPGSNTKAGFLALPAVSQTVVETAVPGLSSALATYTNATSALATAQTALTTATAALATAQAAANGLLATLQSALAPLLSALTSVLDSTPLVSLDSLAVGSSASATSNKAGGQKAEVLNGSLTGLHVLGTDVLNDVLGSSTVDVTDLVGTTAAQLTSAITGLTSTLSKVLSTVPSLPKLSIPAPTVTLLTKSTDTSISDGFGRAENAVHGLTVTIPAITIPSAVALPNAAALPALSGVTQAANGLLKSAPISLSLLTLSDEAAFAPAVTAVAPTTPRTVTPPQAAPSTPTVDLPRTGLPIGVAVLSFTLLAGSLVVRRRNQHV